VQCQLQTKHDEKIRRRNFGPESRLQISVHFSQALRKQVRWLSSLQISVHFSQALRKQAASLAG
jgi:hypothetical protein